MGVGNVSSQRRDTWNEVGDVEDSQIRNPTDSPDANDVRNRGSDDAGGASGSDAEAYADAQMMAPLMKAKVNASGDGASGSPLSSDPRFTDFNKALDAGDGEAALAAAQKLIQDLTKGREPDPQLLNQARMALAAGALMTGKLHDAKQALLGISTKSLSQKDKQQFAELRNLLKDGFRTSFRQAFQADMAGTTMAKDPGKAAADQAKELLEFLQKTEPSNTAEISEAKLRLANAQLAGGHYRQAEQSIAGVSKKQLAPEQSDYLDAIQQEIHAQQIGALGKAFRGDIQQARYKDAAENATALVNDLKKYFPEAKQQLAAARLDQATAQLMNGDDKAAKKSLGQITRDDLKNASGEFRQRYQDLDKQIRSVESAKAEQADVKHRLDTIKWKMQAPGQLLKDDAVVEADKLLADFKAKHPTDTNGIERMKLVVAEAGLAAGDASGSAQIAKEVAGATDDEEIKDQAQLLQAQALLGQKPPQTTEAARMLRSLGNTGSTPETQNEAKDLLIAVESDYVGMVGRKADHEKQAVDDYKRNKFGGGKFEVTFEDPKEKALYKGLADISAGAKLAASVMKANGLTVGQLEGMNEQQLQTLKGVNGPSDAHLLRQTLQMPDMAHVGIDDFQSKRFTWDKGEMYADLSIYDQYGERAAKWIGEQLRGAREQEEEWSHSDSFLLRKYGDYAGGLLDGISAADSFVKDTIKTARDFYARQGGILGKVGGAATSVADMAASTFTMPATVLDYKASDAERATALSGTLLMVATAGLLKAGGPALRQELGALGKGIAESRLGRAVSESWLGDASRAFENSGFAKGVDKVTGKISDTLGAVNRFGRPKVTTNGAGVPGPPETDLPLDPNAADTVNMRRVTGDSDLGTADTLQMPQVQVVEGTNARSVKDVVDEAVGDHTAGELRGTVTDTQVQSFERNLTPEQRQQLLSSKKDELFAAKEREAGHTLSAEEKAQLDPEITRQAAASVKEDLRRMVLGERIYHRNYHGSIEPKPATITQQTYEQQALAKGPQISANRWQSPDGKSTIFEDNTWHHRISAVDGENGLNVRAGVDIRRFYFNLKPDKAADFANYLTDKLNNTTVNGARVKWQYKMPKTVTGFDRPDAGVLYVEKGDYQAVKKIALDYANAHPEAFADEVPAFTKELRPGIAAAEEPVQENLPTTVDDRHSHGSARSDIIAEAIMNAPADATKEQILALVRERMRSYGLDPDRPWLARATSVDDL